MAHKLTGAMMEVVLLGGEPSQAFSTTVINGNYSLNLGDEFRMDVLSASVFANDLVFLRILV